MVHVYWRFEGCTASIFRVIEAARSSETTENIYQTTRHHIQEERIRYIHRRENFYSHTLGNVRTV
jgi:hypothetical protein